MPARPCKWQAGVSTIEHADVEAILQLDEVKMNSGYHDATELLVKLLQGEMKAACGTHFDEYVKTAPSFDEDSQHRNQFTIEHTTFIHQLFQVHLQSAFSCSACSATRTHHDAPQCLWALDIEATSSSGRRQLNDLPQAIQFHLQAKRMDKITKCPGCHGTDSSMRGFTLMEPLPPVVIFHLKRFTENHRRRVAHAVALPANLKLGQTTFELVAVVQMHQGGQHYSTFAKRQGRSKVVWRHHDDEKESVIVPEEEVLLGKEA